MFRFDDHKFYRPHDPELRILGFNANVLAIQRHRGEGPEYIKLGRRVLYPGSSLNKWLESNLVKPTERAA